MSTLLTLEELKKLSTKDLEKEFVSATKELFKIIFESNTGSTKAHHHIRNIKKYRARILTVKSQITTEEAAKFEHQKTINEAKK